MKDPATTPFPASLSAGAARLRAGSGRRLTDLRLYALVAVLSLASSLAGVLIGEAPVPGGADEFSYLLGAQTFAAGRLTNPPHVHWKFFETFHVLVTPSYMTKYPPAQSLVLALGYKLGHPLFGVWLSAAAFALAVAWLLRARLAPRWALLGATLAIVQLGGTHYYVQSYWGGCVAATAGALIVGATLRLQRPPRAATAVGLGLGVALGLLSRPFETVLLGIVPAVALLRAFTAKTAGRAARLRHFLIFAAPFVLAALLFQARLNHAVTGDWRQLPYTAYEARYSGAPLFVWQSARPAPEFSNEIMAVFHRNFVVPSSRFDAPVARVWVRRMVDLFAASLGPVLTLAGILGSLFYPTRAVRLLWGILAVAAIGPVLSYWFYPHYYAGLHGVFLAIGVHGLRAGYFRLPARRRPRFGPFALAALVVCLGARLAATEKYVPLVGRFARAREAIQQRLTAPGEKHLVFVRRLRPYNFHFTWIYNDADLDHSPVVWAYDRGPEANQQLIDYYRGSRQLWLLTERNDRPRLQPFPTHP